MFYRVKKYGAAPIYAPLYFKFLTDKVNSMRSYENSGLNPYNDNYRSESRGSARNYYSDENDLTKRRMRTASAHGRDTLGGFGEGRDVHNTSGYGGTSTYGRSAGISNSNYGSSNRNDRDSWDRAGDEVKSWFGDDDAERRRRMDDMRDSDSNRSSNRGYTNYGSSGYGNSGYRSSNSGQGSSNYGSSNRNDRDRWERTGDEVKSWFGDDDAERRRRMDDMRNSDSNRYSRSGSSYNGPFSSESSNRSNYGSGSSGSYGSSSNYGGTNYGNSGSSYSGSGNYESRNRNWDRNNDNDRDFFDRAGDEVRSWFGDDEAERRRRMDEMRDREQDNDYNSNQRSGSTSSRTYSGPPYSYGSSSRRDYEW